MNTAKQKEEKLRVLGEISMHLFKPILVRFPFGETHPSVDIYAIFRFEPMQILSLGVIRMLKECLWNMLSDDIITTNALRTVSQPCKTFQAVECTILSSVDQFLADSVKRLTCSGVRINFTKQ